MHALFKLALFAILALCLFGSVSAAPIGMAGANELTPRSGNGNLLSASCPSLGWIAFADSTRLTDNVEAGRGACGWNNNNSEHVVAIGGVTKSTCGKTATVTYKHKTVRVKVVDECPVCGPNNIDLSPSAFEQLAPKSEGKLNGVVWNYD
ncbi:hypothetical protein FRC06_008082 [Ceratobasidium sp. 370]|nr:hypothetical protein FRC06_008082 [Ceratobasidium sp. 370]